MKVVFTTPQDEWDLWDRVHSLLKDTNQPFVRMGRDTYLELTTAIDLLSHKTVLAGIRLRPIQYLVSWIKRKCKKPSQEDLEDWEFNSMALHWLKFIEDISERYNIDEDQRRDSQNMIGRDTKTMKIKIIYTIQTEVMPEDNNHPSFRFRPRKRSVIRTRDVLRTRSVISLQDTVLTLKQTIKTKCHNLMSTSTKPIPR